MSNATYCARYRDKRHQEFLGLKKSVDRLLAENQQLRKSVDRLSASVDRLSKENQELRSHVNMGPKSVDRSPESVDRSPESVDMEIEEKQEVRQSVPHARVEDNPLSYESLGKEEERKKPLRGKERKNHPTSPEFEAWWAEWPNKVCKTKAFESYTKALARVSQAELLAGARRYVATKPESQNWCHATTWLNQDRWTDEPAPPVRQRSNGGGSNYTGLFS